MNKLVEETINKVYFQKEYEWFKSKCLISLELFADISSYANDKKIELTSVVENNFPSRMWYFHFSPYIKGEFNVSFRTQLQVSKIIPVFYIEHSFEVENQVEDRMTPILDGWCNYQAYTKSQAEFEDKIVSCLEANNYIRLTYSEINEVVPELAYPEGVTIFGSQVTVEQLLFNDVYNICEEE